MRSKRFWQKGKIMNTDILKNFNFYFKEEGFYAERISEQLKGIEKKSSKQNKDNDERNIGVLLENDRYKALYRFGFERCPDGMDVIGRYLFKLSGTFAGNLSKQPDIEVLREEIVIEPAEQDMEALLSSVPFTNGSTFVTEEWIRSIYKRLNEVFSDEIRDYQGTVAFYLADKSESLTVPERIFFHLVEANEDELPFAFLATYGTRLENGKFKHMPLQYALTEFEHSNEQLLKLLSCLNRVSEVCPLIGEFVESGEMFHPLRLTTREAYELLKCLPEIEKSGVIFRVPNWWRRNAASISMTVSLGKDKPSYVGLGSIIGMQPTLTVDGVPLTKKEIMSLLKQTEGLAFIKGKWVEIDYEKLKSLLDAMDKYNGEVTLLQALRGEVDSNDDKSFDVGPVITNGAWLSGLMEQITHPEKIKKTLPPSTFKAELRPYQKDGYTWLKYMDSLSFGACLADDMGLGKTVQVLAYLETIRKKNKNAHVLLVVPASLLGNWQKEAEKFAPKMPLAVLHGRSAVELDEEIEDEASLPFMVITTYGMATRMEKLDTIMWDCLILDEAQAIKNPGTKQTKALKKIKAKMRIAMTGTPIENDLSNLWSLFDFLNKGLLGSSKEFHDFCKQLDEHPEGYTRLRNMTAPFMLRRLKTDKSIISDLPDKVENVDYVTLSKKQVVLYRKYVKEVEKRLEEVEGMERRGLVLAAITKLKQICNHPDEYLGQEAYEVRDSGKFEVLKALCETIAEKRERVLVFTQFKEIIPYLDGFLAGVFGRRGLVLHGGTPVKKRNAMVEQFQGERYVPYMVISVKAGGTGLNLTNANHVVHFDRWWNPAVENQATDRAYRIGQNKKVIVHKLVCSGTIEERIDAMINDKMKLASDVIGSSGENWITEMSNAEIMSIMRLDV